MSGGQLINIGTMYTPAENNQQHIFYITHQPGYKFANTRVAQ